MKVFVSADIEGVATTTAWEECREGQPGYREAVRQMAAEVAAACRGAFSAGAIEVVVKDAHGGARNLQPADLPAPAKLLRAYSGHPFAMVQGLDETFDAAVFVGYHARGGSGGNPLAHTLSSRKVHEIRLDGVAVSEYELHARAAALVGVPVVLVTGDEALCDEVSASSPGVATVAVKSGQGASTLGLHPDEAVAAIEAGAAAALADDLAAARREPSGPTALEVAYRDQAMAYARSWYPGATLVDPHTVRLELADHFEVLRALVFLVGL